MIKKQESKTPQSEEELVRRAQYAINQCNWVVGECASVWTKRHARGRTDADFAGLIGLSADQVFQRRRVWETFADVREEFPSLKWSHFYVAMNWDDARDFLGWAEDQKATVAEMRLWRQSVRGVDSESNGLPVQLDGDLLALVPNEVAKVQSPGSSPEAALEPWDGGNLPGSTSPDRQGSQADADYAPFRGEAVKPTPGTDAADFDPQAHPSARQFLARTTRMLERYDDALTPELIRELRQLPEMLRGRFIRALDALNTKARRLK